MASVGSRQDPVADVSRTRREWRVSAMSVVLSVTSISVGMQPELGQHFGFVAKYRRSAPRTGLRTLLSPFWHFTCCNDPVYESEADI